MTRPVSASGTSSGTAAAWPEAAEHPGAVRPEAEQRRHADPEELEHVALQRPVPAEAVRRRVEHTVLDDQPDRAEQQEERQLLRPAALVAVPVGEVPEAHVVAGDRDDGGQDAGPHHLEFGGVPYEVEDGQIDQQTHPADRAELGDLMGEQEQPLPQGWSLRRRGSHQVAQPRPVGVLGRRRSLVGEVVRGAATAPTGPL